MSGYVPSTDDVRDAYLDQRDWSTDAATAFDAWIAGVRAAALREGQAEAWADAIGEAYDCGWIHDYGRDEMIDRNPYLTGGDS